MAFGARGADEAVGIVGEAEVFYGVDAPHPACVYVVVDFGLAGVMLVMDDVVVYAAAEESVVVEHSFAYLDACVGAYGGYEHGLAAYGFEEESAESFLLVTPCVVCPEADG